MIHTRSEQLMKEAQTLIPGGVNSPVRAFKAVGGNPIFIERASGCRVIDADGNTYIDYVLSWGPMIVGHAHPQVTRTLKEAVDHGTSFGAPTAREVELASRIRQAFPSMERVRMVNSGTEAVMSAIRLARGVTHRDLILKFEGCYHGHADSLLVKAGSGVATLGIPDSAGVPEDLAKHTLTAPFNDLASVRKVLEEHRQKVACVLVEPVAGNMGVIPPQEGFLEGLRDLTTQHGTLLIFDEVMTGFRVAYGGAQELYQIHPDLTCLGKIIGGGLPVGAFGGRASIMKQLAPEGPVYQAGTLSGNPLAMAAGIETLKLLSQPGTYKHLEEQSRYLQEGLQEISRRTGIASTVMRVGSMLCSFFTSGPVTDYETAKRSDTGRFGKFFLAMLEDGIYIAPSQFEAIFLSTSHGRPEIDQTLQAAERAFLSLR